MMGKLLVWLPVAMAAFGCGRLGFDATADAGGSDATDAAEPAPRLETAVIGDYLFLDFNDDLEIFAAIDKSGNRHDARRGTTRTSGVFGTGHTPADDLVSLRSRPGLFPSAGLTIEAWLEHEGGLLPQLIFGDVVQVPADDVEYVLYLETVADETSLVFSMQPTCADPAITASVPIELGARSHVAVTWDRQAARFYRDGVLLDARPFEVEGCARTANYRVGRVQGNTGSLTGTIDELKISGYAKSASEILSSMNHDSTLATDCGNLYPEPGESCDIESLCCDLKSCRYHASETPCGSGLCNSAGLCEVAAVRDDSDAIVLFDFEVIAGGVVPDVAGTAPALDLTIADPGNVEVGTSSLLISANTTVGSTALGTKISAAVAATNELTVEAWVAPSLESQGLGANGPARIVSLSADISSRGFTLGHNGDRWMLRLTAEPGGNNGIPELFARRGEVTVGEPVHLVMTRSSDGRRVIYVNGVASVASVVAGSLTWPDYPLHLANEASGDRPWLGRFYLVAIYATAFPEERVAAHFATGTGPD